MVAFLELLNCKDASTPFTLIKDVRSRQLINVEMCGDMGIKLYISR